MKIIAVIPARGGSKRIPKKNIIDFSGKPMIAWTIEAAIASNCFTEVFVNTDSPEIADVAEEYGAKTVFLRDQYEDDYSTVSESTGYYTSRLIEKDFQFDIVCQLMANCPLRTEETIRSFCEYFENNGIENLISVVKPKFGNPFWSIEKCSSGLGSFVFQGKLNSRSQDLSEVFYPTGSIWMAKKDILLKTNSFYADSFSVKEIPWVEAVDIDEPEELEIAKKLIG